MLRKPQKKNYMRTDAPKTPEKKLYENRCSEKTQKKNYMRTDATKTTENKLYENRCSEKPP